MRQENTMFETSRLFDLLTFVAIVVFVVLFANAMLSLLSAFQTEVYSSVVADLSTI